MSIWLREVAGWILLGLGVAAFALCYTVFLLERWFIEAGIFASVGVFVFRGGLHLLKVATAARMARDVRKELAATTAPPVRRASAPAAAPAGRSRPTAVPGPTSRQR